ncbi:MAG: hypothetical protein M3044_08350, partial [Thermoproteota archaeon]|nr:hypothetical protein [Thermoproteota archaeon]
ATSPQKCFKFSHIVATAISEQANNTRRKSTKSFRPFLFQAGDDLISDTEIALSCLLNCDALFSNSLTM